MEVEDIVKSSLDKKQYKLIQLENKLECLLISDPQTKKSAASLMVKAGMVKNKKYKEFFVNLKLEDPRDAEGLAHFLEHMLFMGSEKYPEVNDFNSFIQTNSGYTNASTSIDGTKYHFEIANQVFWGALDRWGQFFISPLISESCIEKEINAVEKEFQLGYSEDENRVWEIFRKQADTTSSLNTFGCGNLKTLNQPNIREKLLNFYNRYYCASLMKLCVYSDDSIQDMSKKVSEIFSLVPNKKIQKPINSDFPFSKKKQTLTKVVSIKDENILYVTWIIPNQTKNYRQKSDQYITHLLGFEGRQSLTAFLEDEGLIQSLSADTNVLNDSYQSIEIIIYLTENGFKHWEKVLGYLFKYIRIINTDGVKKQIYEELAEINKIQFQYKENVTSISSYTTSLCEKLHFYPINDILQVNYMYTDFNPQNIHQLLDLLTLSNAIIMLRSSEYADQSQDWQIEEIHGTKFINVPISQKLINICKDDSLLIPKQSDKILGIPFPNEYVPTEFNVLTIENQNINYPTLIHQDNYQDVWFLQDQQFQVCKGNISMHIYPLQKFVMSAKDRVMLELWQYVFSKYIRETEYEGGIALLNLSLGITYNSIEFQLKGFHHHLSKFFQDFMILLILFHSSPSTEVHEHVFESKYEELSQRYENYFLKSPYDLTYSYWKQALHLRGKYNKQDLIEELDKITYKKFLKFVQEIFSRIKIQWFISGNILKQQALNICSNTIKMFQRISQPLDSVISLPIIKIPTGISVCEHVILDNPDEKNSGIYMYFQAHQSTDLKDELIMLLMSNVFSDPSENQLRTIEQLGYVVWSYKNQRRGTFGFIFSIISQEHDPNYLAQRIETFLDQFRGEINNLNEEEFEKMKYSLYEDQTQEYQNLSEKCDEFFKEIKQNSYNFQKKQQVKQTLEQIQLIEFKNCIENIIYNNARRLEIHVINPEHQMENEQLKAIRNSKHLESIKFTKNIEKYEYHEDLFKYI